MSSSTINDLILAAIGNRDEAASTAALRTLRRMGSREVFKKAKALTISVSPRERQLGVDILCQLGTPKHVFRGQSIKILLDLLSVESNADVIYAIGWGLGHLRAEKGICALIKLASHPDPRVRLGVVGGLLHQNRATAIETLIKLSKDEITEIRSWATFALGQEIDTDTADIRHALYERLSDEDGETYTEAVYGLARRKDEKILDTIVDWLLTYSGNSYDLQAACALANPKLLPALLELKSSPLVDTQLLQEAIEKCTSTRTEKLS